MHHCFSPLQTAVDLELLMDRVNDLVEYRIEAVLQEMSGSTLCMLPEDEPVTSEEFVRTTRVSLSRNGFSLTAFQ